MFELWQAYMQRLYEELSLLHQHLFGVCIRRQNQAGRY